MASSSAGRPNFRFTKKGDLILRCLQEAEEVKEKFHQESRKRIKPPKVQQPADVEKEAKKAVLENGGNLNNRIEVLAYFRIQRFQYRGQTFKWLLENDPAYTSYLLRGTIKPETGKGDDPLQNWNWNLAYLKQYALRFPQFTAMHKTLTEQRKAKEMAEKSGDMGLQKVGFGTFRNMTYRELCESTHPEHVRYISHFLIPKLDIQHGSAMYRLREYIMEQRRKLSTPLHSPSVETASCVRPQQPESTSISSVILPSFSIGDPQAPPNITTGLSPVKDTTGIGISSPESPSFLKECDVVPSTLPEIPSEDITHPTNLQASMLSTSASVPSSMIRPTESVASSMARPTESRIITALLEVKEQLETEKPSWNCSPGQTKWMISELKSMGLYPGTLSYNVSSHWEGKSFWRYPPLESYRKDVLLHFLSQIHFISIHCSSGLQRQCALNFALAALHIFRL